MDETHCPREGSGNWVWAVVQPSLVVHSILPSRARYVINDLIGKTPTAVVVSDRYAGYAHIDASQRQVCCSATSPALPSAPASQGASSSACWARAM